MIDSPSPKSTKTEVIWFPVVAVAVIVNVTTAFSCGEVVDDAIVTVGRARGVTVTEDDPFETSPSESCPVTVTRYPPGAP